MNRDANSTKTSHQRPVIWISWLLSLIGVGLSIYLTIAHYTSTSILACSDTGVVNCAKVTTSAQSYFFGAPVAVLGLGFYLSMAVLCAPRAWAAKQRWVHLARLAGVLGGMIFVLWLVYAELLIIGNICLYCTGVHAVTFALLICVVNQTPAVLAGIASSGPTDEPGSE